MHRRKLITLLGAILPVISFRSTVLASKSAADPVQSDSLKSPHAEALSLVLERQQDEISKAELSNFGGHGTDRFRGSKEQYWWFDTIPRSWSVSRPFAPGQIDSTHWFLVSYVVDKTEICSWFVDTAKRTVQLSAKRPLK
ncbi:MAG TPA: hypothetical protein VK117_07285 [Pyrinomonadaceae bacterium]|nr:hypothetical protein [Pyrinomonadaceae bacterium]